MLLSTPCSGQADAQPPAATNAPAPAPASAAATDTATLPTSYQAALAAMRAHDWPHARQLLQQTLAEQPQLAGAWLDLALVAWQQGQNAEALEFLADLEDGFAPLPPPIAQAVATLRQRIHATLPPTPEAPAQAPAGADSAGYLALGLGHDSNANVGLRADAIRLTLPSGQIELPLAASSRQRAAPFAYAALQRTGVSAVQARPIAWLWSLQTRQPSRVHGYSTAEAQAEAATPVGTTAQSPLVGLRLHSAWVGGRLAYLAPGLYTLQRWRTAGASADHSSTTDAPDATPPLALPRTCQWEQRTQLESRNYPRARNLASWGANYHLAWDCASAAQGSSPAWLGQAEASWDAPHHRASRPGGNTWQTGLQLGRRYPNPWGLAGHQLTLGVEWAHIQDTAAYSSLLENGARRIVQRWGWHIEWLLPPQSAASPGFWRWAVQLQGYHQRSNLPLFELRSTTVQLLTTRPW